MFEIKIKRATEEDLKPLNIAEWGTWECEKSSFDWFYDNEEVCYFYEGKVEVETTDGKVEIGPGDLVVFPRGLACKWHVHEPVRKIFKFN
jgi:uncharacterized cupin superfamily protein